MARHARRQGLQDIDEDRMRQPPAPLLMDLTAITRNAKKISTTILMYTEYERSEWIRCGEINLTTRDSSHHKGQWMLKAYLDNATDFEHDSAQAFSFELIGVSLDMIHYGSTRITGWIKPGDPDAFRVSSDPNYNPLKLEDTTKCTTCKGKEAHVIVPEDCYVPRPNLDFYNLCAGRKVEIITGIMRKGGDE